MPKAHQLGRYHLLDRIAFGGMAEIYRAKTFDETGQQRLVAIKRVLGHLVQDEDFVQMLVDEAKICGTLRHPNIAHLYEFARVGDDYFIAMEYVDGKDSRTILDRCRQTGRDVPPLHCAYIIANVAEALDSAHFQKDGLGRPLKIIHRDISPSNVLVSYAGKVKLCDFGIAKATLSRVQTKTGVIKGKVKYMSPEQAMGRKLDHRSDLFSLGSVLYELLTSQPPFFATNEMELLFKVRDAKFRPLSEVNPEVPEALGAIVTKALARSRSARFQTGTEMAHALRAFLRAEAPTYKRSHLAQFVRELFAEDIDRELRHMEEWVLERGDATQMGENLIADALGPDADFRRFSPVMTDIAFVASATQAPTRAFPRVADGGAPQGKALHSAETQILDRSRLAKGAGVPRRRKLDPAFHNATTQIIDRPTTIPARSRPREQTSDGAEAPPTVEERKPRGR